MAAIDASSWVFSEAIGRAATSSRWGSFGSSPVIDVSPMNSVRFSARPALRWARALFAAAAIAGPIGSSQRHHATGSQLCSTAWRSIAAYSARRNASASAKPARLAAAASAPDASP